MQPTRRLAAILFTDIVGSTAIMQKDEQTALSINKRYVDVLKQSVSDHHGEILNDYGDGSLCTFHSATEAIKCAIEMQQQLQTEPKVPLRIGLHVGEIFFDDGKVFGDGVNVASRVQSLGVANSILFSAEINSKIKNQQQFKSVSLGKFHFKNVDEEVEVFALANQGFTVPQKKQIDGKLHEKKSPSKKWIISAAAILLLALLFMAYHFINTKNGLLIKEKSIAILPFIISGNNQDNIGEGLVEDMLVRLSKIGELKVISNRSSMRFADTKKSIKDIGEELNVTFIVTGIIQKIGDKIKVSAQLINSETENTVWAEDYTKEKVEIFDLETEVATQIVTALKAKLTDAEQKGLSKRYTDNVEAYNFYVRGRKFWSNRGKENFDSAELNFKQAIKLDPNYALAYAGIADCYTYNYKGMTQLEAIPIARGYANQALLLDSNLSEGLTSLGFIQHNFDYEWAQSKKTLERAIELDPNNPTAHMYYGNLLQYTGNIKEGLKEVEKAVELDPLSFGANWVLGRNYYFAGENDKAIEQFKKTLKIAPKQDEIIAWSLGLAYYENKLYTQSAQQFDKAVGNYNPIDYSPLMQAYGYALLGNKTRARELLDKSVNEKEKIALSPYREAQVYTALGEYDKALEKLEESYEKRDLHLFWIKVDPGFKALRNQQRFTVLLKKMGLN